MKQHIEKYLLKNPVTIDKNNWYYCESSGIIFVHEVTDKDGLWTQTDQIIIPYRHLRGALNHYDRAKKKQEKAVTKLLS